MRKAVEPSASVAIAKTTAKPKPARAKGDPVNVKSATAPETVHSARLSLKEWLTALENAGLLKPGATLRILMNSKLKRISLPQTPPS